MRRLAAVLAVGLVGCTGYGLVKPDPPPVQALGAPPPGLGQVCVYRPHWVASAVTLIVHDNGNLVGATRGPTYFCWFAQPGLHRLVSEIADEGALQGPQQVDLVVAPGARYHLHQAMNPFGHSLEWLDDVRAAEVVDKCGYRILDAVPGGAVPPGPVPIVGALPPGP